MMILVSPWLFIQRHHQVKMFLCPTTKYLQVTRASQCTMCTMHTYALSPLLTRHPIDNKLVTSLVLISLFKMHYKTATLHSLEADIWTMKLHFITLTIH